jgi:hypothetical protein
MRTLAMLLSLPLVLAWAAPSRGAAEPSGVGPAGRELPDRSTHRAHLGGHAARDRRAGPSARQAHAVEVALEVVEEARDRTADLVQQAQVAAARDAETCLQQRKLYLRVIAHRASEVQDEWQVAQVETDHDEADAAAGRMEELLGHARLLRAEAEACAAAFAAPDGQTSIVIIGPTWKSDRALGKPSPPGR